MTVEEKIKVKKEIVDTIARICTSDAHSCHFGYCIFNKVCAMPYFGIEDIAGAKGRLKSLLKNVRAKEKRKKSGADVKNPVYPNETLTKIANRKQRLLGEIKLILGQDIFEHELVKGHFKTEMQFKNDQGLSIKKVVEVLQQRYILKYGKPKAYGSRFLYHKFQNENSAMNKNP